MIKRNVLSPAEQAAMENAIARAVANAANIDYIAMMTDVEIPTEELEEGTNNESEV